VTAALFFFLFLFYFFYINDLLHGARRQAMVDTCIYLNIRKREKMKSEIKCILVTNMCSYSDYSHPILTVIKTK